MKNYVKDLRKLVGTIPLILAGACVIILDQENRILLQKRADTNTWGLPGGMMEIGESLEDTAKREAFEEVGIIITKLELFQVFSGKELYFKYPHGDEVYNVTVAYLAKSYQNEISIDENEVLEARFFNLDEIPDNLSPDHFVIEHFKNHNSK